MGIFRVGMPPPPVGDACPKCLRPVHSKAICPPWCPPNDYTWFKETAELGRSIGMDNNELALHVWTQYPQRRNKATSAALPVDGLVFQ